MLHTLLPFNERKTLRREYRIRTLIVFCFALSAAALIGVVSLFPSFIRASFEAHDGENALAAVKNGKTDNGLASMQRDLSQAQTLLTTLETGPLRSKFSDLILGLVSMRGPIRINSIAANRNDKGVVALTIQAYSPTRDDLLAFKSRLEPLAIGGKIDLPIASLAKSKDIQFSLQFSEALP